MPVVVKNLLIINGLMFLAQLVTEKAFGFRLEDFLGLRYPGSEAFRPWQFITYMFLHGDFGHLFFNMFALWMFGYALENVWGPKRFLNFYLITGIGAALVHYLVFYWEIRPFLASINQVIDGRSPQAMLNYLTMQNPVMDRFLEGRFNEYKEVIVALNQAISNPGNENFVDSTLANAGLFLNDFKGYYLSMPNVIGASGAVFGILLAFGMLFPNTLIYLYFFFPIKAKWFVIGYGVLELFYGFSGNQPGIAHFAHLGGMIFGFLLIIYWKKKGKLYS